MMVAHRAAGRIREAEGDPQEKGFFHYLGVALSSALLVLVMAVAALVIVIPALVGGSTLTVLTNSMAPKFPPGSVIIIKPTPISEIKVGDVLTFQIASGKPAVISHRVVKRSTTLEGETTFITQGDNNDLADARPVREVQVKGTVWYTLPYLGYLNNAIDAQARPVISAVLAGLAFGYALYTVISSIISGRQKRATRARLAAGSAPVELSSAENIAVIGLSSEGNQKVYRPRGAPAPPRRSRGARDKPSVVVARTYPPVLSADRPRPVGANRA